MASKISDYFEKLKASFYEFFLKKSNVSDVQLIEWNENFSNSH